MQETMEASGLFWMQQTTSLSHQKRQLKSYLICWLLFVQQII